MVDVEEMFKILQLEDIPSRLKEKLRERTYKSKEEFYDYYSALESLASSSILFPNHYVEFYPIIHEHIASRDYTCNLSGVKIKKGRQYITYHPFVYNLKTKTSYTIKKKIKALEEFYSVLPSDLNTYEMWYTYLKNCYYNNDIYLENTGVDFYNLSELCGDNCLDLHPLGLKKIRRN